MDNAVTVDKIAESYDIQPDVIYDDSMDRSSYLVLAEYLWKKAQFSKAEHVLEVAMKKFSDFGDALDLYDIIRADRSSLFQARKSPKSTLRFHLDSLKAGTALRQSELVKAEVRGWIEVSEQGSHLLVQEGDGPIRVVNFTRNRPDVISHLAEKGAQGRILRCGFSFYADLSKRLRISVRSPSSTTLVVEVMKHKIHQVVEGRNGWLFLDNDTNKSVDIFTGRLPASPLNANCWAEYALSAKNRLDEVGVASCVVIAPSKEDVFPELHPQTPAPISLLDVVVSAIFTAGVPVSCPVRRLRQAADSYYRTDTHWSDLGAWICVQDILATLQLALPESFQPIFEDVEVTGDLGSKMSPVQRSFKKRWSADNSTSELTYNNEVSNSGNIRIFKSAAPIIDKKVLIFGGSSSDQISMIMADIFRETIRINCPATMPIMEVVQLCKPDIVLSQSNARYLRSCPKLTDTIKGSALAKLEKSKLPPEWFTA